MRSKTGWIAVAAVFATAGSAPAGTHHPEIDIPPHYLVSPAFQDLANPMKVYKTIYEDFTPIYTTTTLTFAQDFRGRLTGTAKFTSSRTADNRTFGLTGSLKIKKNVVTFTAKGSGENNTSMSLSAVLTEFHSPDASETNRAGAYVVEKQTTNPAELVSTSNFLLNFQIKGTTKPYRFAQDAQTTGADFIHYQKAAPSDIVGLPDKKDSDYYILSTPWGTALAFGNTQLIAPAVVFTLKAPKFTAVLTDLDATAGFEPETYYVKDGVGKFAGVVAP
jgi:hypothetical protein